LRIASGGGGSAQLPSCRPTVDGADVSLTFRNRSKFRRGRQVARWFTDLPGSGRTGKCCTAGRWSISHTTERPPSTLPSCRGTLGVGLKVA